MNRLKLITVILGVYLFLPTIVYAQTPTPEPGNPWGASPYTLGDIIQQARYLYDTFAAPFMLLILGATGFVVVTSAVVTIYRMAKR